MHAHYVRSNEPPRASSFAQPQDAQDLAEICGDLAELLAAVPAGLVPVDEELPRSRKLDRIEAHLQAAHAATFAWARNHWMLDMAGIRVQSGFGRVALFRAWLRAAHMELARGIPA